MYSIHSQLKLSDLPVLTFWLDFNKQRQVNYSRNYLLYQKLYIRKSKLITTSENLNKK